MTGKEFDSIVYRIYKIFDRNNINPSRFTTYRIIDKFFSTLDGGGDLIIDIDSSKIGGSRGETDFPINDQELFFMGESYKDIDDFERRWYG